MSKLLYLGLDPSRFVTPKQLIHYPIIKIEKHPFDSLLQTHFQQLSSCRVVILTSRIAAKLFLEYSSLTSIELAKKLFITVGSATAKLLPSAFIAHPECAEGIIALLEKILPLLRERKIFYPHSAASRPLIAEFLQQRGLPYIESILYSPVTRDEPFPYDLEEFDEIVFTSPSTVEAFFSKKILLPERLELTTIGAITHNVLIKIKKECSSKL